MNFVTKFCYWFITAWITWVAGVQFAGPVLFNQVLVGQRSEYRAQRTRYEWHPEVAATGRERFASIADHCGQQPEQNVGLIKLNFKYNQ